MSKGLRRIPGNISGSTVGKDRHVEKGWKQFFFTDPRCTVQNSTGGACIDSVTETTGNTVITFKTDHSGGSLFPMDGYVAGRPLLTDEGDTVTFGTPFVLKVMIELISISGDYDNAVSAGKSFPMMTMGICMDTDFDADDNRHYGFGCRLMCEGTENIEEDVKWTIDHLETDGSGQDDTSGNAYSGSNNPKLFIGEFMVGPDMATASGNAILMHQEFMASGSNYAVPNANISYTSLNAAQGFNNASTTVTLYAAVQDRHTSAISGNTACVVTARFWYMIEADIHGLWGGSGSA